MKLVLKIFGGFVALIFSLIIIAGIVLIIVVDKNFVEAQMRKALQRHVSIENIDVGIFSVLSGIEVKEVKISNFKTEKQLKALEGKPVPANDLFCEAEGI